MCSVIALAAAGVGLGAAGVGMQAMSTYKAAQAENAANKYNSEIQARNAEVSNLQAADAVERGDLAAKQHLQQVEKLKGEQRAMMGASGFVVDQGSSMDVLLDTTKYGALDAMTIKNNSAREAWAYRNQANDYTAKGVLLTLNKRNAGMEATGTLLTGSSNLLTSSAMLAK